MLNSLSLGGDWTKAISNGFSSALGSRELDMMPGKASQGNINGVWRSIGVFQERRVVRHYSTRPRGVKGRVQCCKGGVLAVRSCWRVLRRDVEWSDLYLESEGLPSAFCS